MSRARLPVYVAALAVALTAGSARADDALLGARVGYYTDAEAVMLGGEALLKVARRVYFNPNLEYVFEDGSYFTFNVDFHYDFPSKGQAFLWAGAGLGVVSIEPPGSDERDTDVALNVLLGVGLRKRPVIPYFQAKLIAKDNTEFSIAFGLRF